MMITPKSPTMMITPKSPAITFMKVGQKKRKTLEMKQGLGFKFGLLLVLMTLFMEYVQGSEENLNDQNLNEELSNIQIPLIVHNENNEETVAVNNYDHNENNEETVAVNDYDHNQNNEENVAVDDFIQCVICIREMNNGEEIQTLNCNHGFHKGCIEAWFVNKNTCPICRAVFNLNLFEEPKISMARTVLNFLARILYGFLVYIFKKVYYHIDWVIGILLWFSAANNYYAHVLTIVSTVMNFLVFMLLRFALKRPLYEFGHPDLVFKYIFNLVNVFAFFGVYWETFNTGENEKMQVISHWNTIPAQIDFYLLLFWCYYGPKFTLIYNYEFIQAQQQQGLQNQQQAIQNQDHPHGIQMMHQNNN